LFFNPALLLQTFGSSQASGCGNAQFVGQCNVADTGIGLQNGQQLKINGVQTARWLVYFGLRRHDEYFIKLFNLK
jgi:hypothetical protein